MRAINESFVCICCGREVPKAAKTSRNHCPYCFRSLHVDGEIPGDRSAKCGGVMKVIQYDFKMSGRSRLLFKCAECGKQHRNKVALDDELDNLEIDSFLAQS